VYLPTYIDLPKLRGYSFSIFCNPLFPYPADVFLLAICFLAAVAFYFYRHNQALKRKLQYEMMDVRSLASQGSGMKKEEKYAQLDKDEEDL